MAHALYQNQPGFLAINSRQYGLAGNESSVFSEQLFNAAGSCLLQITYAEKEGVYLAISPGKHHTYYIQKTSGIYTAETAFILALDLLLDICNKAWIINGNIPCFVEIVKESTHSLPN